MDGNYTRIIRPVLNKPWKQYPTKQELYSIYPTPPSGRIWHKVIFFKRSLTGLNSEFSFSLTSCLLKAEGPSLSYYLPIAGGRIIGFIPFPRVLVKCNQSRPGFELVPPCPFPTTITITPRAPPKQELYVQVRRTRHVGHCQRRKEEFMSNVWLLQMDTPVLVGQVTLIFIKYVQTLDAMQRTCEDW